MRSIPPYDEDEDGERAPASVAALRAAISEADGLLFATPEYNSSIPGALKNAIDWASRPRAKTPLQGKPAAVAGATTGAFAAVWAQAELRKVLASTGARVVDLEPPVARAHEAFAADGALASPHLNDRCSGLVAGLIAEIERDRALSLAA